MQKDNYEFDILVHGKPVQEYYHKGEHFIEGKEGTEFSLRLKNNSSKRVLFVPTIDGLSVMNGKEASFDSNGYLVGPYSSETIDGWRTSNEKVAKFFFSKIEQSYAARTGKDGNVGVIGCAVFKEKYREPEIIMKTIHIEHHHHIQEKPIVPSYPWPTWPHGNTYMCSAGGQMYGMSALNKVEALNSNVSASSLGTGFGEEKYSPVHTVEFDRDPHPTTVFTVQYNTRKTLEDMGVEFKRPLYVSKSAFPKEDDQYCALPSDKVYYGPHPCERCKKMIAKASYEQGGEEFDYPEGPVYPNSEWKKHKCKGK